MQTTKAVPLATAILSAAASHAYAQWTDDPSVNTPIVVNTGDQTVVKADIAPDGSSWTGWFDFGTPGVQLRVQRLDPAGNITFAPEGLTVSANPQGTSVVDWDLRADANGNCALTFVDIRAGGDNDVYAYLIAPDGTQLWGPDGITVSDNNEFEVDPRITQLSGGDYAVVWPRFDVEPGLVMQRISPAGVKAFAGDGVRIYSQGTEEPAFLEMVPTSDNGLLIAWVRDVSSFLSSRHVFAQKFDAFGTPQWGATPVIVQDATSVPIAHKPRIINDRSDGAVIAWHDTRDGDFDCYIQRISPAGTPQYPANGLPASNEPARQQLDPAIAIAPSGDIMVFYRNLDGAQSNQSTNVQRFDAATGSRELGTAGIELIPFDSQFKSAPRAVPHAIGAAAVVDRQPTLGNTDGTYEMLIADESGALLTGNAIPISIAPSSKGRLNLNRDNTGRMIVAWVDDRNGTEDIYAQAVNANGTLGDAPCPADLAAPFGTLNFFDITAYIGLYNAGDPAADFAAPFGSLNFFDISAYITAFNAGCP